MPDWGLGRYELTARELEPVAQRVIAMAGPLRGERVLDIACGTGNAALLAARFRASVTGIDQAPRLIEVARERAAAELLDIDFAVGDAQHLEFPDESFDVAVSIFGVIFAPDPEQAFAEIVRVLRPGGRAFVTAWLPEGTIASMVGVFSRAWAEAAGASLPEPQLKWFDEASVREIATLHGVTFCFHEGELQFVAASPEEYLRVNQENHPMSVGIRPVLEAAGTMDSVLAQALEILRSGNEDPENFRVTSRYRILELRRH